MHSHPHRRLPISEHHAALHSTHGGPLCPKVAAHRVQCHRLFPRLHTTSLHSVFGSSLQPLLNWSIGTFCRIPRATFTQHRVLLMVHYTVSYCHRKEASAYHIEHACATGKETCAILPPVDKSDQNFSRIFHKGAKNEGPKRSRERSRGEITGTCCIAPLTSQGNLRFAATRSARASSCTTSVGAASGTGHRGPPPPGAHRTSE